MWRCVTGRFFRDVSAYFCGLTTKVEKFTENEAEVDITVTTSITEEEISLSD